MRAWQIFIRGMAMGAADLVPGISGGTIAFITGIYERLINALRAFDWRLYRVWKNQGWKGVWQAVDGSFLVSLLAGILTVMLLLAHLISWILTNYPQQLNGFFFGLVAGSAFIISRQVAQWTLLRLLFMFMGGIFASFLSLLLPSLGQVNETTFFFAGMIAICAMILPGISGSFLLLVMGLYGPFVEAIKNLEIVLLLPFIGGALVGLLAFSHILGWLFDHFKAITFATLFGFVVASLQHIWPWQLLQRYRLDEQGKVIPLDTQVLLPWHYFEITSEPSNLISVVTSMLLGLLLVLYLSTRKN
ncbi:putative membrane protein [Marinospirillum celere]|uniref:Putative membrane protein n=1 Tax=Marinospirillum celere TaxID=1122252 RepID=A0A1I1IMT5_9GAMM|nr:DUF368 domain-containing protein [Marinospirillum celere]SFC37221.1 putative membrane protein [Marinospirillum celere]